MLVQSSYFSGDLMKGAVGKDPKEVGKMMEAMFYRMLLKQVREASLGEDLLASHQTDQIKEWQDEELAHQLGALGSLGIADLVEADLQKHEGKAQAYGMLKG